MMGSCPTSPFSATTTLSLMGSSGVQNQGFVYGAKSVGPFIVIVSGVFMFHHGVMAMIEPMKYTTFVKLNPLFAKTNMQFMSHMAQLPINLINATIWHKVQGRTKDAITITSWPKGLHQHPAQQMQWQKILHQDITCGGGMYYSKKQSNVFWELSLTWKFLALSLLFVGILIKEIY